MDALRALGVRLDVFGDGDDRVVESVLRVSGLVERLDCLLDDAPTVEVETVQGR
ncbi:hypothetical protein STANM309S_06631 [Streptomyces tanashiensis]